MKRYGSATLVLFALITLLTGSRMPQASGQQNSNSAPKLKGSLRFKVTDWDEKPAQKIRGVLFMLYRKDTATGQLVSAWPSGPNLSNEGWKIMDQNAEGEYVAIYDLKPDVYDLHIWCIVNGESREGRPMHYNGIVVKPGPRPTQLEDIQLMKGDTLFEKGIPIILPDPAIILSEKLAELQKQIEELKKENEALKARLEKLEKK